MTTLNKAAFGEFFENVIIPVLRKETHTINKIQEKSSAFEDSIVDLPFLLRRNIYKLESDLKKLNHKSTYQKNSFTTQVTTTSLCFEIETYDINNTVDINCVEFSEAEIGVKPISASLLMIF